MQYDSRKCSVSTSVKSRLADFLELTKKCPETDDPAEFLELGDRAPEKPKVEIEIALGVFDVARGKVPAEHEIDLELDALDSELANRDSIATVERLPDLRIQSSSASSNSDEFLVEVQK